MQRCVRQLQSEADGQRRTCADDKGAFRKMYTSVLGGKTEVQLFSNNWTPFFLKFVSDICPKGVAIYHLAFEAGVLGHEINAVFNCLLFV